MKHTYYTDRFVQQCDNDTKRTWLKQGIERNKAYWNHNYTESGLRTYRILSRKIKREDLKRRTNYKKVWKHWHSSFYNKASEVQVEWTLDKYIETKILQMSCDSLLTPFYTTKWKVRK